MKNYSNFKNVKLDSDFIFDFRQVAPLIEDSSVDEDKSYTDETMLNAVFRNKSLESVFSEYDTGELFRSGLQGQSIVSGITELLRYKYLNEPLIADFVLDERSRKDHDGNFMLPGVMYGVTGEKNYSNIKRIGFTSNDIHLLNAYFDRLSDEKKEKMTFYNLIKSFFMYVDDDTVSNLLSEYSKDKYLGNTEGEQVVYDNLMRKIDIIKDYKVDMEKSEEKPLGYLREHLESLIKIRDGLNAEIEKTREEINIRSMAEVRNARGR
jgi:hypothetical protein